MSNKNKKQINWKNINPKIEKLIEFFSGNFRRDPTLYKRIQNWYNLKKDSNEDILDKSMTEWILKGAPLLKIASQFILKDADEFNSRAIKQYFDKGEWKKSMDNAKFLGDFVYDLLGCYQPIGTWFNGLLEYIMNNSRNKMNKDKASEYHDLFFQYCFTARKLKNQ